MDFIKRMKKREFIEMGLKTLATILAGFLAIILMEGMIYGIKLHALTTEDKQHSETLVSDTTTAYCIKQDDGKYIVLAHNELDGTWSCSPNTLRTKEECEKLKISPRVKVVYHAPSAFTLTITSPIHYVLMSVFMTAIVGFYVYKFVRLGQSYQKIEKEFEETGTIEITNI